MKAISERLVRSDSLPPEILPIVNAILGSERRERCQVSDGTHAAPQPRVRPSLLVYVLTLAPTVTGEDSGELITAAATLDRPPAGLSAGASWKAFTCRSLRSAAYQ